MSVLPHGAESVTCQADLFLIPHALLMSKDEVPWSSLRFQDHFALALFPLSLASWH